MTMMGMGWGCSNDFFPADVRAVALDSGEIVFVLLPYASNALVTACVASLSASTFGLVLLLYRGCLRLYLTLYNNLVKTSVGMVTTLCNAPFLLFMYSCVYVPYSSNNLLTCRILQPLFSGANSEDRFSWLCHTLFLVGWHGF